MLKCFFVRSWLFPSFFFFLTSFSFMLCNFDFYVKTLLHGRRSTICRATNSIFTWAPQVSQPFFLTFSLVVTYIVNGQCGCRPFVELKCMGLNFTCVRLNFTCGNMSEHVRLIGGKIWLQVSLIFQMWAPFDIMVLGEISRSQRGLVIVYVQNNQRNPPL